MTNGTIANNYLHLRVSSERTPSIKLPDKYMLEIYVAPFYMLRPAGIHEWGHNL